MRLGYILDDYYNEVMEWLANRPDLSLLERLWSTMERTVLD